MKKKKDDEINKQEEATIVEKEESEKEYVYKYIEGEEKQVIVEKEVKVEVPASSTDATVTFIDVSGNSKSIKIPSGTTINFSAGEHGTYDTVPTSITLTDNQEVDITDSSYNPSKVEVNYIFKGFSYSGNTMKCEYSLANNIVNVECKQIEDSIVRNNVIYIKHDYIESTETQYINTNYIFPYGSKKITQKSKVNVNTSLSVSPFGASNNGGSSFSGVMYDSKLYIGSGYPSISMSLNTDTEVETVINTSGSFSATFNGNSISGNASFVSQNPLYLFADSRVSQGFQFAKQKLYYYQILENDSKKLDLIPIERVSDGEIGLLNLQDGTFYDNKGSGNFKIPSNKIILGTNAGKVMATGSYETGPIVLTAVPNDGYTFVGWSDNTTSATRSITIGDNTVYTALFEPN